MTDFFAPERPVPDGIETSRLLLEPLKPEHVKVDYAAVMVSREQLRLWSGSPWPADDFTLDDNLQDMQWHWREHQDRIAFTYTVLDPARTVCLGCVYMRPLLELQPANPAQLADTAADEALVRFWVRSSRLDGDLERHLLDTLLNWLYDAWSFSRVLFETRELNKRQAQLFEGFPLRLRMSLQMPGRGGTHLFYER